MRTYPDSDKLQYVATDGALEPVESGKEVTGDAAAQSMRVATEITQRAAEIAIFQSRQQLGVIILIGALVLTTIAYAFVVWESVKATQEMIAIQRELLQVERDRLLVEKQSLERAMSQDTKRSARKRQ
jgi:hypothetical protein